jgi:pilus assembly protein Flp/PilA
VPAGHIRQFFSSDEAATSIEYALLGALIAVVCVIAVTAVGTSARDLYTAVCNVLAKASNSPSC